MTKHLLIKEFIHLQIQMEKLDNLVNLMLKDLKSQRLLILGMQMMS